MAFANPLINFLEKNKGKSIFGKWKLTSWRHLSSDIGYAKGLDAFFELYKNNREEINLAVTSQYKAAVDLLDGHTLSEKDIKEIKPTLEKLGYNDIIIKDFNKE